MGRERVQVVVAGEKCRDQEGRPDWSQGGGGQHPGSEEATLLHTLWRREVEFGVIHGGRLGVGGQRKRRGMMIKTDGVVNIKLVFCFCWYRAGNV